MNIGENIKLHRKKLGKTQEWLAKNAGISRNAVYNYESGRRAPDTSTLYNIAIALNIPISTLIYTREQILNEFTFSGFDEAVMDFITESINYARDHIDIEYSSSILVQNLLLNYFALRDANNRFNAPFISTPYKSTNGQIVTGKQMYLDLRSKYIEEFRRIKILELNHAIQGVFSEKINKPELLTAADIQELKALCKGLDDSDIPIKLLDIIKEFKEGV